MRQIILDTETTGLEPSQGHRIIEIGCVELKNRCKTDRQFHQYLNPECEIEDGAYEIHGISNEFLSDKPLFGDIVTEFIDYIRGSEVIIHNAPFDVAFVNAELKRLGDTWGAMEDYCEIIDTLQMVRTMHPGQQNSLDALCVRYQIDKSQRELHGALLDARILLDVYLAMTGGQIALSLTGEDDTGKESLHKIKQIDANRSALVRILPTEDELAAHERRLESINRDSNGHCVWLTLEDNE